MTRVYVCVCVCVHWPWLRSTSFPILREMTLTLAVSELSTLCLSADETANVTLKHVQRVEERRGQIKLTSGWDRRRERTAWGPKSRNRRTRQGGSRFFKATRGQRRRNLTCRGKEGCAVSNFHRNKNWKLGSDLRPLVFTHIHTRHTLRDRFGREQVKIYNAHIISHHISFRNLLYSLFVFNSSGLCWPLWQ